jgi:hypothetical protein
MVPHAAPSATQLVGVQAHGPQSSVPPQPSGVVPHVTPAASHVVAVHGADIAKAHSANARDVPFDR